VNNPDSTRDPFRELIEAHALGALDPEDLRALDAHLATGCLECAAALQEARWLVSQLAYAAPEAQPSAMLRGRLLKTVRAQGVAPARVAWKPAIPFWMWGAVAGSLVFALYSAYEARLLHEHVREMQAALATRTQIQQEASRELAAARREALILGDPNSVRVSMAANNKQVPQLQAAWNPALGLVVIGQKLPAPRRNRTLQLWLIPKAAGAKPLPSLTLRPDAEGRFDLFVENPPDSVQATMALAITEEPEGGSAQPTTTPIWVGTVKAGS
jgi:Anti-sigma-K factor rskA/Putative zinc-finger